MPRRGNRLNAKQLKQRAKENVGPGGKQIRPQKAVAPRAVALGQAVKEAHRLLQQQLHPPGHILKLGDHKNPKQRRGSQQHHRHHQGGNKTGIDRPQAKQADPVPFMQNRVPHGDLDGLRLPAAGGQQARASSTRHRAIHSR